MDSIQHGIGRQDLHLFAESAQCVGWTLIADDKDVEPLIARFGKNRIQATNQRLRIAARADEDADRRLGGVLRRAQLQPMRMPGVGFSEGVDVHPAQMRVDRPAERGDAALGIALARHASLGAAPVIQILGNVADVAASSLRRSMNSKSCTLSNCGRNPPTATASSRRTTSRWPTNITPQIRHGDQSGLRSGSCSWPCADK